MKQQVRIPPYLTTSNTVEKARRKLLRKQGKTIFEWLEKFGTPATKVAKPRQHHGAVYLRRKHP